MKQLHFIDSLNIGGSEGQMTEVCRRLAARGHDVSIGCLRLEGPYVESLAKVGVRCYEFPLSGKLIGPGGFKSVMQLRKFMRRERFDVVQTHDLYSNLLAIPAAWLARVPVIVSSRRDLSSWFWYTRRNKKILKLIQSLSRTVVANSQAVKDHLVEDQGFDPARITVIRNAVDADRYDLQPDRQRVLPMCDPSHRVFATVANMHTDTKGHKFLIEAAAQICRRHPQVRLVFVGDGEIRPRLEAQARSVGVSSSVIFLGRRRDIAEVLAASDGAIHPSLHEGLPNAVLEYLAAGKTTIATAVGGIPEIIENGVNGLLVPPGDAGAIAAAVCRVVEDESLARRLAEQGRRDASRKFSFDALLNRLEELYTKLPSTTSQS